MLQGSIDQQKWIIHKGESIHFEKLRPDDDVRNSGFIFQAQKYKALRRTRSLTHNHPTSHFHSLSVAHILQISSARDLHRVEPGALMGHRMPANRYSRAA